MKSIYILRKLKLILFVFFILISITTFVSTRYIFGSWFTILIGVIGGAFLFEALKAVGGREVFWGKLSFRDKLITVVSFSIILLMGLIPIKAGMSPIFVFIFLFLGLAVSWLITRMLGSEFLRKQMFTPWKDD
jgi:hypothetical protein